MLKEAPMVKPVGKALLPYAYADMPIAKYISKQVDISVSMGKTQREIAGEIGYASPNMISMFKRGEVKVPLDKIPALARALNVDAAFLFKLAIQQYWPDAGEAIAEIFGTVLTKNETAIVEKLRHKSKGSDPQERRVKITIED
jgi:transcriptional regulator with XRE-family HTH domain